MRKHIIFSIFFLVVLGFVLGGSVIAYFSDESSASATQFIPGTVAIAQDGELEVVEGDEEDEVTNQNPAGGDNGDNTGDKTGKITWKIKNIGSKTAMVRVRLIDSWTYLPPENPQGKEETAWGLGTKVPDKPGNRPMYFTYQYDSTPKSVDMMAAQYDHVGWVRVWTTQDGDLKVKYETKEGYSLKEMHLWVGHDESVLLDLGRGQYPYANRDADWDGPGSRTAVFTISKEHYDKNKLIKIAAHCVVYYPATDGVDYTGGDSPLEPNIIKEVIGDNADKWVRGTGEEENYWYYADPVLPGQTITFQIRISKQDTEWKGSGTYEFHLEAEAVQASHGAIDAQWPLNPFVEDNI